MSQSVQHLVSNSALRQIRDQRMSTNNDVPQMEVLLRLRASSWDVMTLCGQSRRLTCRH